MIDKGYAIELVIYMCHDRVKLLMMEDFGIYMYVSAIYYIGTLYSV